MVLLGVLLATAGAGVGAVLAFLLVIPAGILAGYGVKTLLRRRQPQITPREAKLRAFVAKFKALHRERKTHKHVDPVAMQLLEAGSYHWSRVTATLDGPFWNTPNLPGHWVSLKQQAKAAADEAMADLVLLAASCIGEPNTNKSKDWERVFDDLADGDIADAIKGLKSWASGDWGRHGHQSVNAQAILEPGTEIAQSLMTLAEEMEGASKRLVSTTRALEESSRDSIEAVLGNLRTIRQAEKELDDDQQIRI